MAQQIESKDTADVDTDLASGANSTVLELDFNNPGLDLQTLEDALRTSDADFDSIRSVLEQLGASVGGSGGGAAL